MIVLKAEKTWLSHNHNGKGSQFLWGLLGIRKISSASFHPSNLIPGIDLSPDRVMYGKIFAYGAAQRYRLVFQNFNRISVNCPLHKKGDSPGEVSIYSEFRELLYFPSSGNGEIKYIKSGDGGGSWLEGSGNQAGSRSGGQPLPIEDLL